MIRMTSPDASFSSVDVRSGPGRTADSVIEELRRRGFRAGSGGSHVVLERDALRVVVPGSGRWIPPRAVRMIEFGLEAQLGPGWLTAPAPAEHRRLGRLAEAGPRSVRVLEAVVDRDRDAEPWCAFLTEEFSVIGYGDSREDALRDLKRAAARWMDLDPGDLVLVTPTVI